MKTRTLLAGAMIALFGWVRPVAADVPVTHDGSGNLETIGGSAVPQTVSLRNLAVRPGSDLSLSGAGAAPSGRWVLNGVDLTGQTTSSLRLSAFGAVNEGLYQFLVFDGALWVTNREFKLWLDSDGDGLGDAWEVAYFGSATNQTGWLDRDADGTANWLEFIDGTNPTNQNQLLPRLTVYAIGGVVQRSPDKESYSLDELVTLTAFPGAGQSFISWEGDLSGSTNPAVLVMSGNRVVQANFGLPLDVALSTTNPVTTGGKGGWIGDPSAGPLGQPAARVTLPLAGAEDSFLETTVFMPADGLISFMWRIDSGPSSELSVTVDGDNSFPLSRRIIGVTPWSTKSLYAAAGEHTLRWVFYRDAPNLISSSGQSLPADLAFVAQLVTTPFANPLLDTDGNTLPDLWEYHYFDQIGNAPNADPDEDGVSTRTELLDGTDPNTRSSVRPRLRFIIEGDGTAVASPPDDPLPYGQIVTNTATANAGWNFVGWVGPFNRDILLNSVVTNNPAQDQLNISKTYKAIFGLPIGPAVESPGLNWRTSGEVPWYGQNLVSHVGNTAAQSMPLLEFDQSTWLETDVIGPGSLSFWWKVDCAAEGDYLTFLVNSNEVTSRISGYANWQAVALDLAPGPQTLRWLFRREFGYDTNALNIAWLDGVQYTPGPSAPQFVELPATLLGYPTSNLVFRVAARGTPPIRYQVLRNGVPLTALDTNNWITVPNVTDALSGNWIVRAENPVNITDSPPIPVTILPFPPNDDFNNATTLVGAAPGALDHTYAATVETDEPSHGGSGPDSSIWYRWTAAGSGAMRVSVSASNVDYGISVAVYEGTTLSGLKELGSGSGDSFFTNGAWAGQATADWRAVGGHVYRIAVDTRGAGTFVRLDLQATFAPTNDAFANRAPLTGPYVLVDGNNHLATAEPGEPAVFSFPPFFVINASNTLWWAWTAPASGQARLETLSGEITPLLSVFTGNSLGNLNLITNSYPGMTRITFPVARGTIYPISAGDEHGFGGSFHFVLTLDAPSFQLAPPDASGVLNLDLQGPPNTDVALEFSVNLRDWYTISTNRLGSDGRYQLQVDTSARTRTFFRTVVVPH